MALGYLALSKLAIGEERSPWALEHLALIILALGSWHLGTEAQVNRLWAQVVGP